LYLSETFNVYHFLAYDTLRSISVPDKVIISLYNEYSFPFIALTLMIWRQEGHPACVKLGVVFVGGDDLTGALHILWLLLSVTATSVIFGFYKIQNGHILVLAYQGYPGKWPLNEHCVVVQ